MHSYIQHCKYILAHTQSHTDVDIYTYVSKKYGKGCKNVGNLCRVLSERTNERETQVKATKANWGGCHCESGRGGHCEWAKNKKERAHWQPKCCLGVTGFRVRRMDGTKVKRANACGFYCSCQREGAGLRWCGVSQEKGSLAMEWANWRQVARVDSKRKTR